MANFIKVHDHIINVESISKVKCLHDDISLEYFPTDEKGEAEIDYMPWSFAEVELLTGEIVKAEIDLYYLEESQTESEWLEKNRLVIKIGWDNLIGALGNIAKVTGWEYGGLLEG